MPLHIYGNSSYMASMTACMDGVNKDRKRLYTNGCKATLKRDCLHADFSVADSGFC